MIPFQHRSPPGGTFHTQVKRSRNVFVLSVLILVQDNCQKNYSASPSTLVVKGLSSGCYSNAIAFNQTLSHIQTETNVLSAGLFVQIFVRMVLLLIRLPTQCLKLNKEYWQLSTFNQIRLFGISLKNAIKIGWSSYHIATQQIKFVYLFLYSHIPNLIKLT